MEPIALDVHAHLIPVAEARLHEFTGVAWDEACRRLEIDGHAIGLKSLFAADELLAWMDRNGVARAWVSIPPPAYRPHLVAGDAVAWTEAVNRGLSALCARYHGRMEPLSHLPLEHPDVAAEFVARAPHRRFSMSAGGQRLMLSSPEYDPLWKALNARQAFLFLHPGESCDPRLDRFYLSNLLGNPYETALAAAHLIFGGKLAAFPNIQFCLAHAGGALPSVLGRFAQGHATRRPGIDSGSASPRELARGLCLDCVGHSKAALLAAADTVGENRVVFGSDWPFPMGLLDPHVELSDLPAAFRRKIFETNALALLQRSSIS